MSFRSVRWLCSTILVVAAAACADLEAIAPLPPDPLVTEVPDVALPLPSGPHRVGRREVAWYDAGRERTIPIWIYYPAIVVDSAREPVLPDSIWVALHREEVGHLVGPGPAEGLSRLSTMARSDAPIELMMHPYPVLLFAPARGWLPTDYSALLEELTSEGYVVVAFAPPSDAAVVRQFDGTIVPLADASEASHQRTVADFRFIARLLRDSVNAPTWPLRGMLDLQHVAVFGHGLGGTAALLAAARDTAFTAAANLDGDFLGAGSHELPSQPLLYLSTQPHASQDDPTVDGEGRGRAERRRSEMWNTVRADSRLSLRAQVMGMDGGNFLDAALMPQAITQVLHGRVMFGAIDGGRGIKLTAALLDNFFGAVFSGSRANFVDAASRFPEARLSY